MLKLKTQQTRFTSGALSALAAVLLAACSSATALEPPPAVFPTVTPSQPPTATRPATQQPTATPYAPPITRLTDPGCCAQPFWSADSSTVLFIDMPEPTSKNAIYGVPVGGGTPQIISDRVGRFSPDGRYLNYNNNGQTTIRDVASGNEWTLDNNSQLPFFSPTSKRLAWAEITKDGADAGRWPAAVSVSNLDGSDARQIVTVYGGGIGGWLDDDHLLLVGRMQQDGQDIAIFAYNVQDNTLSDIVHESHIRTVTVGPGGQWVLYTTALDPTNSDYDGLWVVKADGSQRFNVAVVGSAHWRDATHLLIIPLDAGAPSHRLWQFDTATGQATPITNPDVSPFRVDKRDWSVSPDGKYVVFVNAQDQALWLITLPPL